MSAPRNKIDAARGNLAALVALVGDAPLREAMLSCLATPPKRTPPPKPRESERVNAALAFFDELRARGVTVAASLEAAANRFRYEDPETLRKARQRRRNKKAQRGDMMSLPGH